MPKNSRRLFGFTLIELLVVISIIGIMLAIGAASFSAAQKGARDARRRAEMRAVQVAMEQRYAALSTYVTGSLCTGAAAASTLTIPSVGGGASTTVTDPAGFSNYTCSSVAATSAVDASFCACALLEITGRGNHTTAAAIPSTSCDAYTDVLSGSGNYFCVQGKQ